MRIYEHRIGPDLGAVAPEYPVRDVPEWYRDAKLGFFVHWGLYSVPAWATAHSEFPRPIEEVYSHHNYAEWYGNTVRIADSPTWHRHHEIYGTGTSYEDFADMWRAESFKADEFVGELMGAGARYVIPTAKHHEGFCLWDTPTTNFNAARRGPKRDLITEIHDETRRQGARFGVYFSGGLDWHVSNFPPIESEVDLFRFRRHDEYFSRYVAEQLTELILKFSPEVLWNDIEWPDGGKGAEDFGLAALMNTYYGMVPDGVVNDRWGIPYQGFLTREYTDVDVIQERVWEHTRGLGFSFGYNQAEDVSHTLTGAELIKTLVNVVSKNGNLLINVGPRADGTIPELQLDAMRELGAWLRVNGDAIYGTRPWIRCCDGPGVAQSYTASNGLVHLHCMDPGPGVIELPADLGYPTEARWADGSEAEIVDGFAKIPPGLRSSPVVVLTIRP